MIIEKIDKEFSVCKVIDYSEVDLTDEYCFIGKTDEENSLVCLLESTPQNTIERDDGWKAFTELEIVGVDGNYCVKAAVIGAVKAGYNVNLDEECIGTSNSKKYKKTKNLFQKLGVTFL